MRNPVKESRPSGSVLHIAGWYPSPYSSIEGNFIQAQIQLFLKEYSGEVIVVQVRNDPSARIRFQSFRLPDGARGFYLFTGLRPGRLTELFSTLLLVFALLRVRAWKFTALHFHVAYPLLIHVRFWRSLFRKKIIISEHWSAYHFNFNLPEGSKALAALRRPFQEKLPVLAVSKALLQDIRAFAQRDDFRGYVIPNVVPLHGASQPRNALPQLFCVSRWVSIKDPMPMLAGLARAVAQGARFELVIGGFGELIGEMRAFVAASELAACARFLGEMTKLEIAAQLGSSDGFVFSSRYETFSVAAAEALAAGVPLIGPKIPAIAEYAGRDDWQIVEASDAKSWATAATEFLERIVAGDFDRPSIAARAAARFAPGVIRAGYREVLDDTLTAGPA
jgi:glycosyltransferase involved in cell wall biosynthesis